MGIIEYHPMLRYDHSPAGATAQCRVGSTPVRSGAVVQAGPVPGGGYAATRRDAADRASVVSPVAPARPAGIEGGGTAGPKIAARRPAAGAGRAGPAGRAAAARLRHRSVDAAPCGDGDRALDRRALSCRACLVHPAGAALVAATTGAPSARARRTGHPAMDRRPVAHGKKNARRQRAWLVFEDESGVSQQPVVRRTWAPGGQTPVLTHTGGSWQRRSVAGALAFRGDGRRTRFYFQPCPGTSSAGPLIRFLRHLRRHR